MTITTEELRRIRAVAEADKNGADGKAWDETVTPDVVIALCDRIEKQQSIITTLEMGAISLSTVKEPQCYLSKYLKERIEELAKE